MNILFIINFFVGFIFSEIPRVSVFGTVRIRLLSPNNQKYRKTNEKNQLKKPNQPGIYIPICIYCMCI